jgi:hypothetical protein
VDHEADRGLRFGGELVPANGLPPEPAGNPLEDYFDRHTTGPGLWKWRHYFPIYHRHFQRFIGQEVHVVEIGVYSGGSLGMWRHYFGPASRVYGVDIDPACRAHEGERIRVFTGDQADPEFWAGFLAEVPAIDVVIDDGSHMPEDQIATLETLLPHIRAAGVYLCEDVLAPTNPFHDYISGLSRNLHSANPGPAPLSRTPTDFQRAIASIHLYPWVAVIEKRATALDRLSAAKQGTEWQPLPRAAS